MTILLESDWTRADGVPRAVVHAETNNVTFKRLASIYRKMGIKNNLFHLALTQPDLAKYDPHNLTDPSVELRMRIVHEADVNVWYFLREMIRIPVSGGSPMRFKAHRGNISMTWCFMAGIDYISVQPRQTGKTIGALSIEVYVIYIHGRYMTVAMATKDNGLLQENVARLKAMRDSLPEYVVHQQRSDTDNKEGISYEAYSNKYLTFVAQSDRNAADRLGRGQTLPIVHFDEPGFFPNIKISHPVILAATSTAKETAQAHGMPSANIYTTTAARTDTEPGEFMYSMINESMPFSEILYDRPSLQDVMDTIKTNSMTGKINGTWSYLQLGFTHEWFVETAARVGGSQEDIDRDYLNIWKAGKDTSILSEAIIAKLKKFSFEPRWTQVLEDGYVISWYVPEDVVKSQGFRIQPFIIGMDSSDAIGQDFTGLTIIDPINMTVVGTFRCNESNIIRLGIMIGMLLVEYEKSVLIPERKSTGSSIIDQVILILIRYGFNPLKRIFNYIIQERDRDERFARIPLNGDVSEGMERKYIGFQTTGKTRPYLYKNVLMKAVSANATRILDRTIINELTTLSAVNGRVDHKAGSHDDMAISYLLACWFIYEGRNLHHYGLESEKFLTELYTSGEDAGLSDAIKKEQEEIKARIKHFKKLVEVTKSPTLKAYFSGQVRLLSNLVNDDTMDVDPTMTEQVRDAVKARPTITVTPTDIVEKSKAMSSLVFG